MKHGLKRWLQRAAAGTAAAALACSICGCSFTTPPLSDVEEEEVEQAIDDAQLVQAGTLTVALDTTDAPQAMLGEGDAYEGYAIDVSIALADRLGLEVAFVHAPSPQDALTSGEADIYMGATARNQSDDIMVSGEYLQNATAVFGGADAVSTSVSAETLENAAIGVQEGSSSQEALADMGVVASNTYSNVNECFEALDAGDVDFVVCDATAGAYLARTYEGMFFAGTIGASTSYGVAYLSTATELSEAVGEALDEIASDGTLDAIHTLWYGSMPLNLSSELIAGVTVPEEAEEKPADEDHEDINDF